MHTKNTHIMPHQHYKISRPCFPPKSDYHVHWLACAYWQCYAQVNACTCTSYYAKLIICIFVLIKGVP